MSNALIKKHSFETLKQKQHVDILKKTQLKTPVEEKQENLSKKKIERKQFEK